MNDQLRAYLDEQASELDESVRQVLSITNGDAIAAAPGVDHRCELFAGGNRQAEIAGID